ncbi:hypothetical protein OBBRIDRAFT_776951 [Obba rivulosa]|uniref:Heterokaryon incompatibility domain-containing protein n=1 Tax=Obba rivulosa TaxID=1052685 RepID=A0A8E2AYJ4_9APHY|nr:hypothetical protein OBBRIDRAFT_776951 [Obba rivulosa]
MSSDTHVMEFRVLVETNNPPGPDVLDIDGMSWTLTPPLDIESATIPPYVCISYTWGDQRDRNPLRPTVEMSINTLRVVRAVVSQFSGKAIWIDAFSIPTDPLRKRATLESLGYIFSNAEAVVAVLSAESAYAIQRIDALLTGVQPGHAPSEVPSDVLDVLDMDAWIRSVWTYQEVVNSRELYFIMGTGPSTRVVEGEHFLNILGHYYTIFTRSHHTKSLAIQAEYPYVNSILDLLAEWQMQQSHSVMSIMSGMNHRVWTTPVNYFYSVIGSITTQPSRRPVQSSVEDLAEKTMVISETKGDFSFIFAALPRDIRPGNRWRPQPGVLNSILTSHPWGYRQSARRVDGGVVLENVVVLPTTDEEGEMSEEAKRYLSDLISSNLFGDDLDDKNIAIEAYHIFKKLGFLGPEEWYMTTDGYFYPFESLPNGRGRRICISGELRWVFGAPGLALVEYEGDMCYTPGIHLGLVRSELSEILLH